jgi:hypothetical protein
MSVDHEPTIADRIKEAPQVTPDKLKEVRPRQMAVRFLAGAVTSIAAGLITLGFGARAGGLFLAFPAILAASLTLIQREEDSAHAREDARGAVLGGCALAAFGAVAAVALVGLPGSVALVLAAAAWALVALVGYRLFWR